MSMNVQPTCAGVSMSNPTFNSVILRYSKRDGKIYFDDYINCIARLSIMFGTQLVVLNCFFSFATYACDIWRCSGRSHLISFLTRWQSQYSVLGSGISKIRLVLFTVSHKKRATLFSIITPAVRRFLYKNRPKNGGVIQTNQPYTNTL